jgi:hypothetical protein
MNHARLFGTPRSIVRDTYVRQQTEYLTAAG